MLDLLPDLSVWFGSAWWRSAKAGYVDNPQDGGPPGEAPVTSTVPAWRMRIKVALGLRHHEDIRSIGIVATTWFLFVLRWTMRDVAMPWSVCFVWWATQAFLSFFCATIVHNCVHVPQFNAEWQNKAWQIILSLSYGFAVTVLIPGHNLSHHKYTQGPKDVIRTSKLRWQYNFFNLIFFALTCFPSIQWQDSAWMQKQAEKSRPVFWQALREVGTVACVNFLLFLWDWKAFLIHVFAPQVFAKAGLISINLPQHDGCPTPEEDKYNFARNFTGPILNFLSCNNGYHTIHHMYPGLHWTRLKEEHMKQVHPYIHPSLEQDNIVWYMFKTYILPGGRTMYDGSPYKMPPPVPDEPWFVGDITETYSDKADKAM
jgi:fatty acid desaturase